MIVSRMNLNREGIRKDHVLLHVKSKKLCNMHSKTENIGITWS